MDPTHPPLRVHVYSRVLGDFFAASHICCLDILIAAWFSYLTSGRVKMVVGDGREGYAEFAPYDAIHVGAAAPVLPKVEKIMILQWEREF